MVNFIVNADDFGRSKGISDNISECLNVGILNSVSVPATGHAVEYALKNFKDRSNVRLAVHLDLVEHKPISSLDQVFHLIDKDGYFCFSFFSLWFKYFISPKKIKTEMEQQVKTELRNQINLVKSYMPHQSEINVDSHQHMHMIPFVFKIVLDLANEQNIKYIRVSNEPFFIYIKTYYHLTNYLGPNLVKHFLLNLLTKMYIPKLINKNIKYPDYFIGTLFTGKMCYQAIKCALEKIPEQTNATIEILFHACKAIPGEEHLWRRLPGLKRYYFSKYRDMEKKEVCNTELGILLSNYAHAIK